MAGGGKEHLEWTSESRWLWLAETGRREMAMSRSRSAGHSRDELCPGIRMIVSFCRLGHVVETLHNTKDGLYYMLTMVQFLFN